MTEVQWRPGAWPEVVALYRDSESVVFHRKDGTLDIETPEGRVTVWPGDWIVKDARGEFHRRKAALREG